MDKQEKRDAKSGSKGKGKFIAIGIGIAVVIAIGVGVAMSTRGGAPQIPNSTLSNSRTVSWIHVHGLGIDPSDSSILYIATHGDFYKSVNGGAPVKVDKQRADYMAFNAPQTAGVPLYSSGHPATGGNTGLIKSTDGGQTWEVVATVLDPPVDFHAMAVSKSDPKTIIGYDSGGGGLFENCDAGKTRGKVGFSGKDGAALTFSPNDAYTRFI